MIVEGDVDHGNDPQPMEKSRSVTPTNHLILKCYMPEC